MGFLNAEARDIEPSVLYLDAAVGALLIQCVNVACSGKAFVCRLCTRASLSVRSVGRTPEKACANTTSPTFGFNFCVSRERLPKLESTCWTVRPCLDSPLHSAPGNISRENTLLKGTSACFCGRKERTCLAHFSQTLPACPGAFSH